MTHIGISPKSIRSLSYIPFYFLGILLLLTLPVWLNGQDSNVPWANGAEVSFITDQGGLLSVCKDCVELRYSSIRYTATDHVGVINNSSRARPFSPPLQATGGGEPIDKVRKFRVEHQDGLFRLRTLNGQYLGVCKCLKGSDTPILVGTYKLENGKVRPEALFSALPVGSSPRDIKYVIFNPQSERYWSRYRHSDIKFTKANVRDVTAVYRHAPDIVATHFEVVVHSGGLSDPPDSQRNVAMKDVLKVFYDDFTSVAAAFGRWNPQATYYNTAIDDFSTISIYQNSNEVIKPLAVGLKDHPNSMTLTQSGRMVFDMSRAHTDRDFGGCVIVSEPGSLTDLQRSEWTVDCEQFYSGYTDAMQAAGEVVMISSSADNTVKTRFFMISEDGRLNEYLHLRRNAQAAPFIGLTYDALTKRYYAISATGTTKNYGTNGTLTLYRSEAGRALSDRDNKFEEFGTIASAPISQQGAQLIAQEDGRIFLVNAFVNQPDEEVGTGIGTCTFGGARPWHETISVSELALPATVGGTGSILRTKHKIIGIVHQGALQPCIDTRPSWRYAGAFTPVGAEAGVILWTSRWRRASPTHFFTAGYDYAARTIGTLD